MFGTCDACSGLVSQSLSDLTSASSIISRIQSVEASLTNGIVSLVPEISAISFSYDSSSRNLYADITLSSGVLDVDTVYNKLTYELSRIFDVFPGTIAWSTVPAGKRSSNTIVIDVYDEIPPQDSFAAPQAASLFWFLLFSFVLREFF